MTSLQQDLQEEPSFRPPIRHQSENAKPSSRTPPTSKYALFESLNKRQKVAVALAALAFLFTGLRPPLVWGRGVRYSWLWSHSGSRIESSRLFVEWVLIAFCAAVLVIVLSDGCSFAWVNTIRRFWSRWTWRRFVKNRSAFGARRLLKRRKWAYTAAILTIAVIGLIGYRYAREIDAGKTVVPDSSFEQTPTIRPKDVDVVPSRAAQSSPQVAWDDEAKLTPQEQNADIFDKIPASNGYPKAAPSKPSAVPDPSDYNREPNGARIVNDVGISGLGKLTVENGTALDAAVRLSNSYTQETARWFYVWATATVTVDKIEPGTYALMYTTGADWDEETDEFRKGSDYSVFERQFTYLETPDGGNTTKYTTITVTLHAVPSGNVRTRHISRQEFLKGHHKQKASH